MKFTACPLFAGQAGAGADAAADAACEVSMVLQRVRWKLQISGLAVRATDLPAQLVSRCPLEKMVSSCATRAAAACV